MPVSLKNLKARIAALSAAEKAELVRRLALDLAHAFPGIEKTPGVSKRAACIVRTRIPVWTLERYRALGWSEARLLDNFPTLTAADLVSAWSYAAAHPDQIAREIVDNKEA